MDVKKAGWYFDFTGGAPVPYFNGQPVTNVTKVTIDAYPFDIKATVHLTNFASRVFPGRVVLIDNDGVRVEQDQGEEKPIDELKEEFKKRLNPENHPLKPLIDV